MKIIKDIIFYFANDDDNKWIKSGSTPTYFECLGFKWIGSNWKDLMTNFTKWYLEIGIKSKEDYLNMITEFSKQEIFSTEQKVNYLGPFKK